MKRLLVGLSFACSLAAAAAPTAPAGPALKAGVFEPPRQAPELMLRGSDGSELKLSRYRGKLVLMSFGFTSCAAVCPVTLATLTQARKLLGPQADSVQVVFITVDPERDDPQRMKTFLAAFDPTFIGATGKPEALEAVRRSYGVSARKIPMADGYLFDHSSSIFLIDAEGRLRAMMPYGHEAKDFVHDIKLLLAK
jgi:protein SCO1/2